MGESKTEVQLPQEGNTEQIEAWKEQYGKRLKQFKLEPEDIDDEVYTGFCLVPTRKVYGQFEKFINSDPDKARSILINNCLLTDKQNVLNDFELFLSVSSAIIELIPLRKSTSQSL